MKISKEVQTQRAVSFLVASAQQHKNLLIVSKDTFTKREFANHLQEQAEQDVKVVQEFMGEDVGERLKYIPTVEDKSVVMQAFGTSPKTALERLEVIGMTGGIGKSFMQERLFGAVDLIVYVAHVDATVHVINISLLEMQEGHIEILPIFSEQFLEHNIPESKRFEWIRELLVTNEVFVPKSSKLLRETSALQFQQ